MIKSIQLSGIHSSITKEEKAYAKKKVGALDKYIPKDARESVSVEMKLKQAKAKNKQSYEFEVIMNLPKATITAHEKATTALEAIDLVEANLRNQLKKYKDKHGSSRFHRHVIARFRRKNA